MKIICVFTYNMGHRLYVSIKLRNREVIEELFNFKLLQYVCGTILVPFFFILNSLLKFTSSFQQTVEEINGLH